MRATAEVRRSFEAAERKLGHLGLMSSVAVDGSMMDYRSYSLSRFDEVLGITVLDWPAIGHYQLVARAVSRTPPFDPRGSRYRDALIWADVVTLAAGAGTSYWYARQGLRRQRWHPPRRASR